jgi:transcriptional regulator with XRE-family HTH domain
MHTPIVELLHIGQTIAMHRQRQKWSQDRLVTELRAAGFSVTRGYVAGVETNRLDASKAFLIACEQVFHLKPDTLLMYAALGHAQKFCMETKRPLNRYMNMVGEALKSIIPAQSGHDQEAVAGQSGDLEAPVSRRVVSKKVTVRSIMLSPSFASV